MWQTTDDGPHHDDGATWVEVPLLRASLQPQFDHYPDGRRGRRPSPFRHRERRSDARWNDYGEASVALPLNDDGSAPPKEVAEVLLQFESMGLEQDRPVWENLSNMRPKYTDEDANVLAYRQWCNPYSLERAEERASTPERAQAAQSPG